MNSSKQYIIATFSLLVIATAGLVSARSCRSCGPSRPVVRRTEPVVIRTEPIRTVQPKVTKEVSPISQEIGKVEATVKQEVETIETDVKKEEIKGGGKVISVESMDELDKYIKAGGRVIVDVYAHWCGPCKSFAPLYEKFAAKYPSITSLKVDAEKVRGAQTWTINGQKVKITGYPTFIVLKDGRAIGKDSGAPSSVERFESKITAIKGAEDFLK